MDAEFQLLCVCAMHPLRPDEVAALRRLCQQTSDWPRLLRLGQRHGLLPLLHHNLKQHAADLLPASILADLQQFNGRNSRPSLQLAAELNRLAGLFAAAGVPLCPLKGPLLAQRLYGDVGLRAMLDLDLLVAEGQFQAAEALLQANGYRREVPRAGLTPLRWRVYRQISHHVVYVHRVSRLRVELHWALSDAALLPPAASAQFLARAHPLGRAGLLDLSDEDLLAYLVVHGSQHAWTRLKWLSDVAVLLRRDPPPDWSLVYERMAALDLLRPLGQALRLARDLFAWPVPPSFAALIEDAAVQALAQQALASIHAGGDVADGERPMPRLRLLRYHLRMKGSWVYAWRVVGQLLFVQDDWDQVTLPDWLFPLYLLLRPFLWLWRAIWPRR
jgi:hypothetical protein